MPPGSLWWERLPVLTLGFGSITWDKHWLVWCYHCLLGMSGGLGADPQLSQELIGPGYALDCFSQLYGPVIEVHQWLLVDRSTG